MYPAIPCFAGDIAAGRVEAARSFAQKNHHAAAGDSAFHLVKRPVWTPTA